MIRLVDEGTSLARQVLQLMDVNIRTRIFLDSRPLLESIGSSGKIKEKQLRQSMAYLKQSLEDSDILGYS